MRHRGRLGLHDNTLLTHLPGRSIIKLNNDLVLYLREVSRHLALVCLLRVENFERQGLLDYNFHCFRSAIHEVFRIRGMGAKAGWGAAAE